MAAAKGRKISDEFAGPLGRDAPARQSTRRLAFAAGQFEGPVPKPTAPIDHIYAALCVAAAPCPTISTPALERRPESTQIGV